MSKHFGHFEGDVVTRWLKDDDGGDRTMELVQPFAYVEPSRMRWEAGVGRRVNGASIPRVLWEEVGPPFIGNYRRATVLHDVAWEDGAEPAAAVDRMFYNAMRCDDVAGCTALLMYWGVRLYRWVLSRAIAPAAPGEMTRDELKHIKTAVEAAVAELGETADLDALNETVEKNLPRSLSPRGNQR